MASATERVNIVVTEDGSVTVKKNIDNIGTASTASSLKVANLNNSLSKTKSVSSSFSVGNIAAQFQDIAVTSAMMQSPLQIALQQGTQLSAAFGQGGLGGVFRQLGAALASVLSPVSLLTIGFVALAAIGIQNVNWMKVFQVTGGYVLTALQRLMQILPALIPYLTALGAAFLVAFGPAIIASVFALTAAIGGALGGAIVGLFALLAANPLTLIISSIAFIITEMYSWQDIIQSTITYFGQLEETIGRVLDAFGVINGLTAQGIRIQLDAKQAASDIVAAGEKMRSQINSALRAGQDYLRDGGTQAGKLVQNGMVAGGKDAAASIQAGTEAGAQAIYQALNGVPQAVKGAIQAGADYTYNQVTGAVEKSAPALDKAVTDGGTKAAGSVQQAMQTGGQSAAQSLTLAGQTVSGQIAEVIQQSALRVAAIILLQLDAQYRQMSAQATLTAAQSAAILRGGGSGAGTTGASGGSSGSGAGLQPTRDSHYVRTFNSDGTPYTGNPAQTHSVSGGTPAFGVTIVNKVDPNSSLQAINTDAGNKEVLNVIKTNVNDVRQILGIV